MDGWLQPRERTFKANRLILKQSHIDAAFQSSLPPYSDVFPVKTECLYEQRSLKLQV